MRNKRPSYLRTHTLISRLAVTVTFGRIAKWCGCKMQTAEAWGREPESHETPTGTGKHNPFDTTLRLIGKTHAGGDTALAREMAEMHVEYVDFLDGRGRDSGEMGEIRTLALRSAREHLDVVDLALGADDLDWEAVEIEIGEAEVAFANLKRFVKQKLRPETLKAVKN